MIETYRPSGKFSPTFLVFTLLGAGAAVATAWLYQFLMSLIPLIYLNFAITIGFAVALCMGLGVLVRAGRCRNAIVAVAAALVIGGLGAGATHYFSYQFTLDEVADMEGLDEAQAAALAQQVTFSQFIDVRVDNGWSFGKVGRSGDGAPISGFFVWLIWGIEGLALIGAAGFGAFGAARSPFCESCSEWSEDGEAFMFPAPSEATLDAVRAVASAEALLDVEIDPTGRPNGGLLFKPSACPSCSDTHHLSVCHRIVTIDSDGKEDIKDTDLLTHVVLTDEQAERVRSIGLGEEMPQEEAMDDWSEVAFADTAEADALQSPKPDESPEPDESSKPDRSSKPDKPSKPEAAATAAPEPALEGDDDGTW